MDESRESLSICHKTAGAWILLSSLLFFRNIDSSFCSAARRGASQIRKLDQEGGDFDRSSLTGWFFRSRFCQQRERQCCFRESDVRDRRASVGPPRWCSHPDADPTTVLCSSRLGRCYVTDRFVRTRGARAAPNTPEKGSRRFVDRKRPSMWRTEGEEPSFVQARPSGTMTKTKPATTTTTTTRNIVRSLVSLFFSSSFLPQSVFFSLLLF